VWVDILDRRKGRLYVVWWVQRRSVGGAWACNDGGLGVLELLDVEWRRIVLRERRVVETPMYMQRYVTAVDCLDGGAWRGTRGGNSAKTRGCVVFKY
jgi:hypothetical protein